MKAWADAYKAKFGLEPDGLALGQYDAVMMALTLIAGGADTRRSSSPPSTARPTRASP